MISPLAHRGRAAFDRMAETHDSSLPAWGPYSKIAAGIAHVADPVRGAAFNLSVFPAIYRGQAQLPTETVQSNFHPWYASGDLSFYTYRFELEWKDRFYCDVSYIRQSDDAVLIEIDAHNETDLPQQLGVHYLSSMQFPRAGEGFARWVKPACDSCAAYTDGVRYKKLTLATAAPQDNLVYDGKFLCEVNGSDMVQGRALGGRFGKTAGDCVEYEIDCPPSPHPKLMLRARGRADFRLGGCVSGELTIDSADFALYTIPLSDAHGRLSFTLTCLGGEGAVIDTVAVAETPVRFEPDAPYIVPQITDEGNCLTLAYREDCVYGVVWHGRDHMTREILGSDWERIMQHHVMDHVNTVVRGNGQAHFTDLYARPFFLAPHSRRTMYALVCRGDAAAHAARFAASDPAALAAAARARLPREAADPYALSQRLMRATILTNLVFPVYVQGQFIRHFTPGKWWDSLYTWDSGFIALGLTALDEERALDTLNCYLTEPGNPHAAFIHHGSPVPVQAYVYKALWDKCRNPDYLASFYPRMRQYYEFLMGRAPSSVTRKMRSGLINTFAYFYNSGGWDDYPPQAETHRRHIAATTCPAAPTTHAIVFARILRQASALLGLGEEARYDADVAALESALQTYSWDEDAGYFSYVTHDAEGNPTGVLRDGDGVNYNMGLDGAEAILSGICTPTQERRLADAVMDGARMWTDCGISTVDKSAPYYREDGYWNGAVWMPHQWFVFLGMLALCRPDDAAKIARTALDTWKRETDETYNCYEHFILTSGRGGGWHHFSGLSSPVVLWHAALYTPGTLTAPPGTWIMASDFSGEGTAARVTVDAAASRRGASTLWITMAPGEYRVTVNGEEQRASVYECAVSVEIPDGRRSEIRVEPIGGRTAKEK